MTEPDYPHVYDWQRAVLDTWADELVNTGGNPPIELLNDYQKPDSRMMTTNVA